MTPEQITKLPLKKLTSEQRKFYFKHGYLLVKSLISESALKKLRLSADQLWKRRFDPNLSSDFEFDVCLKLHPNENKEEVVIL